MRTQVVEGIRPGEMKQNYYVTESVGIACGLLLMALHEAGLATLTHTPNPMGFLNRLFLQKEALAQFFDVLDTRSTVHDRPSAVRLPRVKGEVRFESVSLSYDGERPAVQLRQ